MRISRTAAERIADVVEAEAAYANARALLDMVEAKRYAAIWEAVRASDVPTVKAMTPATVTRATINAAARRHAGPSNWIQPKLFNEETCQ